jgi:hypothetical protein
VSVTVAGYRLTLFQDRGHYVGESLERGRICDRIAPDTPQRS